MGSTACTCLGEFAPSDNGPTWAVQVYDPCCTATHAATAA